MLPSYSTYKQAYRLYDTNHLLNTSIMTTPWKDYPLTSITNPGSHDILCGRGGGINAHPGNIKFRKLVATHKLRYLGASKSDKPSVAWDVVREWRALDPPGRFLAKMEKGKNSDEAAFAKRMKKKKGGKDGEDDDGEQPVLWHDVGDKKAREKASQCLRERNGAANEAVAALVKTVTATGEACPEDYATLMNRAAMVTVQQQNQEGQWSPTGEQQKEGGVPYMGQVDVEARDRGYKKQSNAKQKSMQSLDAEQRHRAFLRQEGAAGPAAGGTNFETVMDEMSKMRRDMSMHQQQHQLLQRYGRGLGDGGVDDDMVEAEIQRLQQQRMRYYGQPLPGGFGGGFGGAMGGGMGMGGGGFSEEDMVEAEMHRLQRQQFYQRYFGLGGGNDDNANGGNNGDMIESEIQRLLCSECGERKRKRPAETPV